MENIANHIPILKMRRIWRPDGVYYHLSISLENAIQHTVLLCEKHGTSTCQSFRCSNTYWLDNPLGKSMKNLPRVVSDNYTQAYCALRGEKGYIKIHFTMRRNWRYPSYCSDWCYGGLDPRFLNQQEVLQEGMCLISNIANLHTITSTPNSISITPYQP